MGTRVVHKTASPPTENFLETFTGWSKGALGVGAARKMFLGMVPAIGKWLEGRGSNVTLELEGFDSGVNSGILHIRNGWDFRVILVKVRGDSIISWDGIEVFLAGKEGAARLAARFSDAIASLTPVLGRLNPVSCHDCV